MRLYLGNFGKCHYGGGGGRREACHRQYKEIGIWKECSFRGQRVASNVIQILGRPKKSLELLFPGRGQREFRSLRHSSLLLCNMAGPCSRVGVRGGISQNKPLCNVRASLPTFKIRLKDCTPRKHPCLLCLVLSPRIRRGEGRTLWFVRVLKQFSTGLLHVCTSGEQRH